METNIKKLAFSIFHSLFINCELSNIFSSLALKNSSLALKNSSLALKNSSLALKNSSLALKNSSLALKNSLLGLKNPYFMRSYDLRKALKDLKKENNKTRVHASARPFHLNAKILLLLLFL
jgi:hypothetical protein